jgi:predicted DNA-binding transcriptional regulator YafY
MPNAFERRQEILSVMNARRHDTIDNLAVAFEVSRRTIERDLSTLSSKYPIYTTQGVGGGVHIMDGASAGQKYLTAEQEALLEKLLTGLEGRDEQIMRVILRTFTVMKK